MIQNYGQQYVSSSPDTGSNDDETPVEPECETIVANAMQPHTMGERRVCLFVVLSIKMQKNQIQLPQLPKHCTEKRKPKKHSNYNLLNTHTHTKE